MQLFVAIDDSLTESVLCLDNARLNKQINESYQASEIIKLIMSGNTKAVGYRYHPIISMWKDSLIAVEYYHDLCLAEWIRRGKNNDFDKDCRNYFNPDLTKLKLPNWFGNPKVHASHRSKLLFKGSIDAVVKTLEIKFGRYNSWKNHFHIILPDKNKLKHKHREFLYKQVKKHKLYLLPNHYSQFGWKEPDNLNYVYIT